MMNSNDLKRRNESMSRAPIFLRKIYDMLETTDPNLICWSDDGLHFAIKDHERFASEVIPQYFTHNNFSSFVRQLNFHGFRKIKLDPLKISLQQVQVEANYWRYMHKNFRRGRPELLCQVRGRHQQNSDGGLDPREYEIMKDEVHFLRTQVSELTNDVKSVSSLIHKMIQDGSFESEFTEKEAAANCSPSCPPAATPLDNVVSKRDFDGLVEMTSPITENNKRCRLGVTVIPDNGNTRYQTITSTRMLQRPETLPNRTVHEDNSEPVYRLSPQDNRLSLNDAQVVLEMNFKRVASEKAIDPSDRLDRPHDVKSQDQKIVDSSTADNCFPGRASNFERRDSMASVGSIPSIDTDFIFRDDEELMKLEQVITMPPLPPLKAIHDETGHEQKNNLFEGGVGRLQSKQRSLPEMSLAYKYENQDNSTSGRNRGNQQGLSNCYSWSYPSTGDSRDALFEREPLRNVVG